MWAPIMTSLARDAHWSKWHKFPGVTATFCLCLRPTLQERTIPGTVSLAKTPWLEWSYTPYSSHLAKNRDSLQMPSKYLSSTHGLLWFPPHIRSSFYRISEDFIQCKLIPFSSLLPAFSRSTLYSLPTHFISSLKSTTQLQQPIEFGLCCPYMSDCVTVHRTLRNQSGEDWKLCPYWLAFMVLEGSIHTARGAKTSSISRKAVNPENDYNDCSSKKSQLKPRIRCCGVLSHKWDISLPPASQHSGSIIEEEGIRGCGEPFQNTVFWMV